ncbi:MAG: CsbD family protein [Planctomycetes bacterium]|nr:CsbD family protein [Planctomycetota bacterium]
MNKNQVKGSTKRVAGTIQRAVGEAVGSPKQQILGAAKQVSGTLQRKVGDAQAAAKAKRKRKASPR